MMLLAMTSDVFPTFRLSPSTAISNDAPQYTGE